MLKATFTTPRGYRIRVEPANGQNRQQLHAKAKQIMQKRGITSTITITDATD